ncbi:MAG TPA: hypothetical protein VFD92_12575 [Candidatus Binatia bacterium]|nr:hypothetical protein [Candidatus Binatia bacterium]
MHDLHDAGAAEGPVLPDDEERIRRDTDEVIRLYGEFLRRLSHQGVRDIADLVRLHDQVSRAAATVALPEIDFALTQIRALIDRVRLIGARLERLGQIRRAVRPPTGE